MSKKEIITLVIVYVIVTFLTATFVYTMGNTEVDSNKTKNSKVAKNSLKVDDYTLEYGKYRGYEEEYNADTGKTEKKDMLIVLTKDKINSSKYTVKGKSLYINGVEIYQVTGNNKILMLVGSGVEFEYDK